MAFGLMSGCPGVAMWACGGSQGSRRHAGNNTPGTSPWRDTGVASAGLSGLSSRRGSDFGTGLGSTRIGGDLGDAIGEM